MTSVLTSPEDICNAVLARIGYKIRIGNMLEGSPASKIFLDIYGQTRDQLMRDGDWGFAEKITAGVTAGVAPSPWSFQYQYPADCLRMRQVFNPTYTSDVNNPTPALWRIGTGISGTASIEAVWSQVPTATFVYTKQVTDPTQWEATFIEALIEALSRRATIALAKLDPAILQGAAAESAVEQSAHQTAADTVG